MEPVTVHSTYPVSYTHLLFETNYGCEGALVVGLAAATFGLVSGGLVGGPVGNFLVRRHGLAETAAARREDPTQASTHEMEIPLSAKGMVLSLIHILAIGF